MKMTEGAR